MTPSPTRTTPAHEAALARVAELCRALAWDVPIGALVIVGRDLRVRMAAGPRWRAGGLDPEAMAGMHMSEWVPADLLPAVMDHYDAALAGEARRFTVSTPEEYRTTVVPIRADDGSVAGCLSLAWDESAALQAERAAGAELARRLAQQSAVARLGELALERPTLEVLTGYACEAVREGLGVDAVYLLEHVGDAGMMRVRATSGFPDGFVGSEFEMRSFAHASGRELCAKGPVVIDDLPNDLAHALGMRVVPEGVETAGQLARLVELGCDYAQGYHLARPLPAAGFGELLRVTLPSHEGVRPAVRRPA